MKVIDDDLLEEFRRKIRCEWCKTLQRQGCDPAHIYSRAAGQVDVKENLVSLCRLCHTKSHNSHSGERSPRPTRGDLLKIAATREGTTPEAITDLVQQTRADKSCKVKIVSQHDRTRNLRKKNRPRIA